MATPRVLGIEQRHQQSNLPYRDNTFSSSSSPVQLSLGILSTNSAFWPKTPNSVSLAGTAWLETSGVVDDDSFRLTGKLFRGSLSCYTRCRSLLAYLRAGRPTKQLNRRGGRHLYWTTARSYMGYIRFVFFRGISFLFSLVVITDTHTCNFLRVLGNQNNGNCVSQLPSYFQSSFLLSFSRASLHMYPTVSRSTRVTQQHESASLRISDTFSHPR